ncbi:MAG: zinc ABC transporter substrate-binding protein [Clostridia bacterium]|nr:zinc ABC transporter substrate-binding protein [Clostridia bacterium]
MKKLTTLLLCTCLLFTFLFSGAQAAEKPVRIVTTIFPLYDWTREIIGEEEGFEITLLLDSGVDLHNFQPTAKDIMNIATCDLFIYVGGESDDWVEDTLQETANPEMRAINLIDALGDAVKLEEMVEGMEAEHEEEDEEEEEEEADEHVWLSLRNAEAAVTIICQELSNLLPEKAETFEQNAEQYIAALQGLDQQYGEMVAAGNVDTVLFGDRFPFRYLTDDYGLQYYAAFSGCSAETEASFQTIVFLSQKVQELQLPAVLTIEGTNHKIAETIIQNTAEKNQKLLVMDSMQGITIGDVNDGASYLGIMEKNLAVLQEALNR